MVVLVDYENTLEKGLHGIELLKETDTLILFYSDNCNRIESLQLQKVMDTGCKLNICKLINKGNNALDFYIAVRVGEIISCEQNTEPVAIVSKDRGFNAILDYCASVRPAVTIACGTSILECCKRMNNETAAAELIPLEKAVGMYNDLRISQNKKPCGLIEFTTTRETKNNISTNEMLMLCGVEPCASKWDTLPADEKKKVVDKLVSFREETDDPLLKNISGRALFMLNFTKAMDKCSRKVDAVAKDNKDFTNLFKKVFVKTIKTWDDGWNNYDPNAISAENYIENIINNIMQGEGVQTEDTKPSAQPKLTPEEEKKAAQKKKKTIENLKKKSIKELYRICKNRVPVTDTFTSTQMRDIKVGDEFIVLLDRNKDTITPKNLNEKTSKVAEKSPKSVCGYFTVKGKKKKCRISSSNIYTKNDMVNKMAEFFDDMK